MEKPIFSAFVIAVALAATTACATDARKSAEDQQKQAAPAANPGPSNDPSMAQMSDHMKKMQDMMDKIGKTSDPAARRKLMHEHMQAMHEGMKMMRGMGGGMMMGGPPGSAGRPGDASAQERGRRHGPMMGDEGMMEKRMDMMHMMMEQMMQHQSALEGPPPRK